jgi:hypothetical protein
MPRTTRRQSEKTRMAEILGEHLAAKAKAKWAPAISALGTV